MIRHARRAGFVLSLVVLSASAARAQAHPPHPGNHPHGAHAGADSATHAALHSLLMGSWTGHATDAAGHSAAIQMRVTVDSLHRVALTMNGARLSGMARDLSVRGDTLQWNQMVAGASCLASAVPMVGGAQTEISGRITCGTESIPFTVGKLAR